ncbi:MAG: DUF3365 domain-containing protein [Pseudomonadota bacterium]
MKTIPTILALTLTLFLSSGFAGDSVTSSLTAEEETQVSEIGQKAVKKLSKALIKTLVGDIKSLGFAEAARGWEKSLNILKQTADSFGNGMDIKRPTFLTRNPDNGPDRYEATALKHLEEKFPSRRKDAQYFQKIDRDGSVYYRYYKPIYIAKKCLNCHSAKMGEDVKAVLREKYPDDKAANMHIGDFRGAIRIEVPASALNL